MYKINEIMKKFLLAGDKFILETHLRRHKFTYSALERFTKNKQKHKNLKKLEIQDIIYQKELDKAYFQHDMAYGDFKDLPRKTASDRVFCDKAVNIIKSLIYDEYQRDLAGGLILHVVLLLMHGQRH